MRILHVVLTPRFSGAEILVRDLSLLHCSYGHVSGVAALNPAEPSFKEIIEQTKEVGVNWYVPEQKMGKVKRISFLKKQILAFEPDVILAHSVIPAAYARLVDKRRRVISVLHSADENDYKSVYLGFSEHILQHRLAGVIAVSPVAAENYRRRFKTSEISVIPNGVQVQKIQNTDVRRQEHRARFGIKNDIRLILQVGRIVDVKQQHLTLRALTPMLSKDSSVQIWFAGLVENAFYLNDLKSWVKNHRLEQQVRFLGSRQDVPELMSASDLIVMPSAQEAHSVALIEALASGSPVIASTIQSFRYASAYPGVKLLDPEDSMTFRKKVESALENKFRFKRDLSEYEIAKTADNYLQFIGKTIKNGKNSTH